MNYDNHLFRVSSLGHIMAGASFKKDVYNAAHAKQLELYDKMNKLQDEYDVLPNKTLKTAATLQDKANKASDVFYLQRRLVEELSKEMDGVEISEGCKTHLMNVFIAHEFGRPTKDIKSKYIEKGLQMEEAGMVAYGIVKGWIPEKSTVRKDDTFIMGEIDFERGDTIYDNKSSWDIFTFFNNIKYLDNPRSNPYYWQMQGYMKLWDKPKAKLVYTLLDTPEKLIENEKKLFQYSFTGSEEMLVEALEEIQKNLTYSDIPIDRRIIEIPIERNDDDIANIPNVVKACRVYLNELSKKEYYYERPNSQ